MTTATLPDFMTKDMLVTSNAVLQATEVPPELIESACRLISRAADGAWGVWAYEAFDYINATFFSAELPTPFLLWTVTEWGGCLGSTQPSTPTVIRLHPGLRGFQGDPDKKTVWGYPRALLGLPFAYDTVLHECIHMSVAQRLGGARGPTSHNNPQWIAEVNRIAPMLGLNISAGRSKLMRVPIQGQFTKTGKAATRVVRGTEGDIPFDAVARFPRAVRIYFGAIDWYLDKRLPFPHVFETSHWMLQGGRKPQPEKVLLEWMRERPEAFDRSVSAAVKAAVLEHAGAEIREDQP